MEIQALVILVSVFPHVIAPLTLIALSLLVMIEPIVTPVPSEFYTLPIFTALPPTLTEPVISIPL